MAIKFGDVKYFTLLGLQDKLRARQYDNLGLLSLDKLRLEVEMKIKAIDWEHKNTNAIKP